MNGSNWAKHLSNLSSDQAFNEAGAKPSPVDHWTSGRKRNGLSAFSSGNSKTWLSGSTAKSE